MKHKPGVKTRGHQSTEKGTQHPDRRRAQSVGSATPAHRTLTPHEWDALMRSILLREVDRFKAAAEGVLAREDAAEWRLLVSLSVEQARELPESVPLHVVPLTELAWVAGPAAASLRQGPPPGCVQLVVRIYRTTYTTVPDKESGKTLRVKVMSPQGVQVAVSHFGLATPADAPADAPAEP